MSNKHRLLICLIALLVPALLSAQVRRTGAPEPDRSLMELPAVAEEDIILVYEGFVVNYNPQWLQPNWVAYELTAEEVEGEVPRARGFGMDPHYPERQAMREDYSNTGWDKGHMAPAADMKWSLTAMNESFYLTNICPQDPTLNGADWHALERQVRAWAQQYGRVQVVCGPYVTDNAFGTIGERRVVVPDGFFKAVLRTDPDGSCHAIAFVFANHARRQRLRDAVVSVDAVEALTGFDFFPNLPDEIEESIESASRWEAWQ